MKKAVLYILVFVLILSSCKKDGSGSRSVRYEFTSNISANYKMQYATDNNSHLIETFTGTTWTKSVSMIKQEGIGNVNVARLTVYPPAAWANAATSAKIMIKIFVNNEQKIATDTVLNASNIDAGIFSIISF
ncbi:MAG: hypothetical protein ABIU77_18710 [Ferruginibacter sp.]